MKNYEKKKQDTFTVFDEIELLFYTIILNRKLDAFTTHSYHSCSPVMLLISKYFHIFVVFIDI